MICACCGLETDHETACTECAEPPLLHQRYELLEALARRASGATYRARDRDTQSEVVVKELMLRKTKDLKEIELFEREAELLKRLDHPQIPAILDDFEVQRRKSVGLYLVQEFIDATSLERRLADHRFTPEEVAKVLADGCDLLGYLRSMDPPVVHRDIKPANLLRADDGTLFLVDFGAARAVADSIHHAGSTVAGTFGYMAPEQLVGAAVPASDVFALGATAIRLLTGRHPGDLWGDGARFDWDRNAYDASFAGLLDAMTCARAADRPSDLATVAEELRQFAWSKTGLARHRSSLVSSGETVPRPSPLIAWAGFGTKLGMFAVAVIGTVGVIAFMATNGEHPAMLILYGVIILLAIVPMGLRELARRVFRWHLLRFAPATRGIVIAREFEADSAEFVVRYLLDGITYESSARISIDEAIELEPGDEVIVCAHTQFAKKCAVAALSTDDL